MTDMRVKQLEDQLKRIGSNYRFWGRSELRQLAYLLLPGEKLEHCVNGTYQNGFALLAATDKRLLLIDKKPSHLILEDVRFELVTEVQFSYRLLNASVLISTPVKTIRFVAYNHAKLRGLFRFTQSRIVEIRRHYSQLQRSQPSQQPGMIQTVMQQLISTTAQTEPVQVEAQVVQTADRTRVIPTISAYTRLPLISRQRRFLGSRAINSPQPSIYQ